MQGSVNERRGGPDSVMKLTGSFELLSKALIVSISHFYMDTSFFDSYHFICFKYVYG